MLVRFSSGLLWLVSLSMAAQAPEAAPGLRIPSGERPWAFEIFQGKPQLVPVHSAAVQPNNHKGANVAGGLLAGPFYKAKFTTELQGAHARTVLHTPTPVFYVHFKGNADEGTSMIAGWAIVRAATSDDMRLLSTVKFTQLSGNAKRNASQVESVAEQLPDGWLRISPKNALEPGEYVLEPVPHQENAFATVVYDFGVNTAAPNDPDATGIPAPAPTP